MSLMKNFHIISFPIILVLLIMTAAAHAEFLKVSTVGEYIVPSNMVEPSEVSLERARMEATRSAAEEIGFFISTHSKSKGLLLENDEVEVLTAQIIKIDEEKTRKEILPNGDIKFTVSIEAVADSDELDLEKIYKNKQELEQIIVLNKKLDKMYNEQKIVNDNLRKLYSDAKNIPNEDEVLQGYRIQKQMNDKRFLDLNNFVTKWEQSQKLMKQNKYDDAIAVLKDISAKDDGTMQTALYGVIGTCYAMPIVTEMNKLTRLSVPPDKEMSNKYLKLIPRIDQAIGYIEKTVTLSDEKTLAYDFLSSLHGFKGTIYGLNDQIEKSIEEYDIALEQIQNSRIDRVNSLKLGISSSYIRLADKEIKQNHFDNAIKNLNLSIENWPPNYNLDLLSKIHIYKGDIYLSRHMYKEAVDCYDDALSINPRNEAIVDKRDWVYSRMKNS